MPRVKFNPKIISMGGDPDGVWRNETLRSRIPTAVAMSRAWSGTTTSAS